MPKRVITVQIEDETRDAEEAEMATHMSLMDEMVLEFRCGMPLNTWLSIQAEYEASALDRVANRADGGQDALRRERARKGAISRILNANPHDVKVRAFPVDLGWRLDDPRRWEAEDQQCRFYKWLTTR